MEKADKVTIRLTPEQASAIDFLVERGEFKNRSEAIRASIDKLLQGPEEKEGITINLPDTMMDAIDLLVSIDHFVNKELGIRELVRNGLQQVNIQELRSRQEVLAEMGAERSAKDLLEVQYKNMLKE